MLAWEMTAGIDNSGGGCLPLRNISVRPDSGKGNSPSKGAGKAWKRNLRLPILVTPGTTISSTKTGAGGPWETSTCLRMSPSLVKRLKILGVEEDRDLSDLVNEAIGDLLGKREKR